MRCDLIQCIPAVRRLFIRDVGPWRVAELEFSECLNIITGPSGSGKSSLLQALRPNPHTLLRPHFLSTGGKVEIDYADKRLSYDLTTTSGGWKSDDNQSHGQNLFRLLAESLAHTSTGWCLLIDDEVLSCFDPDHYNRAINLLNNATCQVIAVLTDRYDLRQLRNARIFQCTKHHSAPDQRCCEVTLPR